MSKKNPTKNNLSLTNNPYAGGPVRYGQGFSQQSSSRSSSSSSVYSDEGKKIYRNISQQVNNQTSQLLTDRPNLGKKLEIGDRNNSTLGQPFTNNNDKSNERREVSVVSGNSIGVGNNSYSN